MDSILTNVSRNSFLWMKSWLAGTLLKATYFSLAMKPNPLIDLKADEFAPSFPNDPLINSLQINESVNLLIRKCVGAIVSVSSSTVPIILAVLSFWCLC